MLNPIVTVHRHQAFLGTPFAPAEHLRPTSFWELLQEVSGCWINGLERAWDLREAI